MAKPVVRLTFRNKKAFELALDEFVEKTVPAQHLAVQKKVAIDLLSRIIEKTPVGNPDLWKESSLPAPKGYVGGRARANWQISIGSPGSSASVAPETGVKHKDKISGLQEAEGFAAMASAKAGGTIWIYNNLRYIKRLEDGWSHKQAPLGMVAVSLAEIEAGLSGS